MAPNADEDLGVRGADASFAFRAPDVPERLAAANLEAAPTRTSGAPHTTIPSLITGWVDG